MKKKKTLLGLVLGACVLVPGIIMFTGCGNKTPDHEHSYSTEWSSDGTNHWHDATCEHSDQKTDVSGHTYGDWTITDPATCTEDGEKERGCTVCHHKDTDTVPSTGHKYSQDWAHDANYHWHNATCEHISETTTKIAHAYDKEVVAPEYLKTAATYISKAVYYKSCECGVKGTETFEVGEILPAPSNAISSLTLAGWTYGETGGTPTASATYGQSTMTFTYFDSEGHNLGTAKPSAAGAYTVKAKVEAYADTDEAWQEAEAELQFTIAQKEVTLNWNAPAGTNMSGEITFDGTTKTGSVTVTGLVGSDECSVAKKDIALTGDNRNVTIEGFYFTATKLSGSNSANYKLPTDCDSPTLHISPKNLTITNLHVTYDGSKSYKGIKIGMSNTNSIGQPADANTIEIDVSYTGAGSAPAPNTYSNMYNGGDWCVAVTKENSNYNVLLDSANGFTFVIEKIEVKLTATYGVVYGSPSLFGTNHITADQCTGIVEGIAFNSPEISMTIEANKAVGKYGKTYFDGITASIDSPYYTLSDDSDITLYIYEEAIDASTLEGTSIAYTDEWEVKYFAFTPTSSGVYKLIGNSTFATSVENESILTNTSYTNGNYYSLEADKTYYIKVMYCGSTGFNFTVTLNKLDEATNLLTTGFVQDYDSSKVGKTLRYNFRINTAGVYTLTDDQCITASIAKQTPIASNYYYLTAGSYMLEIYVNSAEYDQSVQLTSKDITSNLLSGSYSYMATSVTDGHSYYYSFNVTTAGAYELALTNGSGNISIIDKLPFTTGTYDLAVGTYVIKLDVGIAGGDIEIECSRYIAYSLTVGELVENITIDEDEMICFKVSDLEEGDYSLQSGTNLNFYYAYKTDGTLVSDDGEGNFSIEETGDYYVFVYNDGAATTTGAFGII